MARRNLQHQREEPPRSAEGRKEYQTEWRTLGGCDTAATGRFGAQRCGRDGVARCFTLSAVSSTIPVRAERWSTRPRLFPKRSPPHKDWSYLREIGETR